MRTFWLASYPKSGNTWMRILLANLVAGGGEAADINRLRGGFAGARPPFDSVTLIDSGLLSFDEIDALRPRVYEALAAGDAGDTTTDDGSHHHRDGADAPVHFVKVHDAYHLTSRGEPVLAGRRGPEGAVVIVRDPRDIAPSFAHHGRMDIDRTIAFMNDSDACFCGATDRGHQQLRQKLMRWSEHVGSWLAQRDLPVHLVRYEDLQRAPTATLRAALDFAGWPVSDTAIERAVALSAFDRVAAQERETGFREAPHKRSFFRRGEAGAWRSDLTAAQVARIEHDHAPMMQRLGYPLTSAPCLSEAG
ncbi:MAG: sulfotransferase domain-containing protein [Proteobacteria bacterium]|nr:sulfotransferase domain-containing protein [Pseudomonadota bacterium]